MMNLSLQKIKHARANFLWSQLAISTMKSVSLGIIDWLHLIVPFYISIYVFVEAFHIGTKDVKCVFLLSINIYKTDEKLQLCSDVQAP